MLLKVLQWQLRASCAVVSFLKAEELVVIPSEVHVTL